MINSLEKALKETWENKEKFYEDNKNLTIIEILEKIEGRKFNTKLESPVITINTQPAAAAWVGDRM